MLFTALWEQPRPAVQWGVVIGVSVVAAVCDAKRRRIPNILVGPTLVGGFVWAAWVGGASALVDAAVGCLVLGAPFVLLFVFAGGGAGDAKLMMAIGAWLGVVNGLVALVAVALSGVVFGIVMAVAKKRLGTVARNVYQSVAYLFLLLRGRHGVAGVLPQAPDSQKMPYAVAIFAGVCVAAISVAIWRISS